jgi:hypothetical protein
MHATDLADGSHGTLYSGEEDAELGGQLVGEVARLRVMLPGFQKHDDRQARGAVERPEAPALRRPEVLVVAGRTAAAVDATLAVSNRVTFRWGRESPWAQLAVERERLPLVDRGHSQRTGRTGKELLRSLGHGERC